MRISNKTVLITLALLAGLIVFHVPSRVNLWIRDLRGVPYADYPSLLPKAEQTVGVRFDPSFYYHGQRPAQLAESVARQWSEAGVNLVYFRAYDPRYGAFYRTDYAASQMGEYGRFDLLGAVLDACHKRNIRVFAWFPVLNHGGAWQAHPQWRSRTRDGKDLTEQGLEFPLCARNPEVRQWWQGFLEDFLKHYPRIDGVDLGEPVVDWKADQACFCDACAAAARQQAVLPAEERRAQALTQLLTQSITLVHRAGKPVCITTVQPADERGELLTPGVVLALTGFDLTALIHAGDPPDFLCPEFIWQEQRSRERQQPAGASVFTPQWTEGAVRKFMEWVDRPLPVIAHVEISDFPGVKTTDKELGAAMEAALRGGSQGIDVYSTHLLDEKKAWSAFAAAGAAVPRKRCLVLYDSETGKNDGIQTGELLRHFQSTVELKEIAEYTTGTLTRYDNVYYLGTAEESAVPGALIADLKRNNSTTVCWVGFNIESILDDKTLAGRLGLEYLGTDQDHFTTVHYQGEKLRKSEPWTVLLKAVDPARARVLAQADDGKRQVPYAVRCGRNFWYFADVPTSFAVEGDRMAVFSDLLHEIMNEEHQHAHLAMVRIEDVHPLTDPAALRALADMLHNEHVPFQIALVPIYVYPEMNMRVAMNERPEFVKAIQYMVRQGGTVVLHGVTHQRFGESTSDYEFWDAVSDSPPDGENESSIRERLETGLRLCWSLGIYPLMWETPHYAGSQELYGTLRKVFSVVMERRQSLDRIGSDQYFPWLIPHDRYGQMIVPENLGYIPLDHQDPAVITDPAHALKVIRDGVASFFYHPFLDPKLLGRIVRTMKADGYQFTNAASLPLRVETPFGVVSNSPIQMHLTTKQPEGVEADLAFPGFSRNERTVRAGQNGRYDQTITPETGHIVAAHFVPPPASAANSQEAADGKESKNESRPAKRNALKFVPSHFGEVCSIPNPLILSDPKAPAESRKEEAVYERMLELVGITPLHLDVEQFTHIPDNINLLIVPTAAARRLSRGQLNTMVKAVQKNHVALVTNGFSPLSENIGIEKTDRQITVRHVRDDYYSNVDITWPSPKKMNVFGAPGDAGFYYEDQDTSSPLVVGSPLGKGRYFFIGTPLADVSPGGGLGEYPYLLTHMFNYLKLAPAVRGAEGEIYFDPEERTDISIEEMIKYWRRSGVRSIYVSAWQVNPQWTYDYARLIHLAHTNAMLVYAWFELPFVSEKFWADHPQWRERSAAGREAVVDWRKAMALEDPECLTGTKAELRRLVEQYDWDGVLLNRAGLEADKTGPAKPESYTPFHPAARVAFKAAQGFDPQDLFNPASEHAWQKNPGALRQFEAWRAETARTTLDSILRMLDGLRQGSRRDLEIILSFDPHRPHSGLTLEDMRAMKRKHAIHLQYLPDYSEQWAAPPPGFDLTRLTMSPPAGAGPFLPGASTRYPTGLALYEQLVRLMREQRRFSLYTEIGLYEVDAQWLTFLFGSTCQLHWREGDLVTEAPKSGEIIFSRLKRQEVALDEQPASTFYMDRLFFPVGIHRIALLRAGSSPQGGLRSNARLMDCTADLQRFSTTFRGMKLDYFSDRRAPMVFNSQPRDLVLDGQSVPFKTEKGLRGWSVVLPAGSHSAEIITRSVADMTISMASLCLSSGIVVISTCSITGLLSIMGLTLWKSRRRRANSQEVN